MTSIKKRIFFRIYPIENIDFDYIKIDKASNQIYARQLQDLGKGCLEKEPNYWVFPHDGVFMNTTQERIYNEIVNGVLENVINGYNGVIMAFGQTGSGKTFTISGLHLTEQEFGIIPRIARDLLKLRKESPKNIKISIQMSYVEFYNTYSIDLLEELPNIIEIHKSRKVRKVIVNNELDALQYIFLAEGRKRFVKKKKRYFSNLATSVVTFHIIKKDMDLTNPIKIYSRLHVLDLAGNDICNTNIKDKNPKEIGLANITKSQLEQFVLLLSKNTPEYIKLIKQRINALVYYLDGDFSNESFLRFIGHIKVTKENLIMTLSTLRFGNVLQGLKPKKKVIEVGINEEVELAYLRNKLKTIEKEQYLNSVLLNQDLNGEINLERINHLNNLVDDYLADGIKEITVMNVADIEVVLKRIKNVCNNYQNDVKILKEENETFKILTKEKSDTSIKGTRSSSRKLSRARLSKDSIGKDRKNSETFISEKRLKTSSGSNNNVSDIQLSVASKRKKSLKSPSGAFKHSSHSKRKSSTTSVEKQNSKISVKSSPEQYLPIPEILPEKQEVWKQFSSGSFYKEKIEEYKLNEIDVKSSFTNYINEIKKLQACREIIENRKNDLLMAQTNKKFNSNDEFDDKGNRILSTAEISCKDRIDESEENLLQQQEKVLTAQELFKIYLANRKDIVKRIQIEFDQFCNEHYRAPCLEDVVHEELTLLTFDANLDFPEVVLQQYDHEPLVEVPDVSQMTKMVNDLQRLMKFERKKRLRMLEKKNREWKNV